jgi:hypothetical protein
MISAGECRHRHSCLPDFLRDSGTKGLERIIQIVEPAANQLRFPDCRSATVRALRKGCGVGPAKGGDEALSGGETTCWAVSVRVSNVLIVPVAAC